MRLLNRPLAFLLAAALLIASVVLVIEVVAYAVNAHPVIVHWNHWMTWADKTRWKAGVVRFWAVVLMVIGLVLLVLELKPRRARRIPVGAADDDVDAAITRRGLTSVVQNAALGVGGVRRAAVSAKKRKVTVSATSAVRDKHVSDTLVDPITSAARDALDTLALAKRPKLAVRVAPRSK